MRHEEGALAFSFRGFPVSKRLLLEARQRCRDFSVTDVPRSDGKRFVVRADEKLTALLELERGYMSSWWV